MQALGNDLLVTISNLAVKKYTTSPNIQLVKYQEGIHHFW